METFRIGNVCSATRQKSDGFPGISWTPARIEAEACSKILLATEGSRIGFSATGADLLRQEVTWIRV